MAASSAQPSAAAVAPPAAGLPRLEFEVARAEAPSHTATPLIRLALRVRAEQPAAIDSLLLDCQARIAPRRRSYPDGGERERLTDLFGPEQQWGRSLEGLLWAQLPIFVPGFEGEVEAALDIPCGYDFEVSANRYLAALGDGAIPLELLFSGTVFWSEGEGRRRIARLPLDREASFELPVATWRQAIDRHFPGAAWLRLSRERFARLQAYRARRALPSWDAVLDSLLASDDEGANR